MADPILVPAASDLAPGDALRIDTDLTGVADVIAIFRDDDGQFYALNDTCTHEEASLADGWIEGGEVECPLHAARFCLRTGEVRSMPATIDTSTHRIEVRDGQVWLFPGEPAVNA